MPDQTPDFPRLSIEPAGQAWKLIFQSGVLVDCQVDQSLSDLLTLDFGLSQEDISGIEALILDGNAVDDSQTALIQDQARLALAAGLPGVAGLAMKKGSALKGLRNSITQKEEPIPEKSRPGRICLALYSLVLDRLGGKFLRRGIWVTAKQIRRYAPFSPDDQVREGEAVWTMAEFLEEIEHNPRELYFLTAGIAASPQVPSETEKPGRQASSSGKRNKGSGGSCQDCPIGCQLAQRTGWKRHQEELIQLWELDPEEEGLTELINEFKYLANDLGLEAFELSGSLALVLLGTGSPRTAAAVRGLFEELKNDTPLGHLLGSGRVAAARAYGLDPEQLSPPQKNTPWPPETAAFLDGLGICEQAAGPLMDRPDSLEALGDILEARYGRPFARAELEDMGPNTCSMEIEFGKAAAGKTSRH
ncbi:MAG: hypothetical protein LBK52_06680 [Deltaproteobacteria bacterium]|jgi:hypothetical protein|nr:hypothetical protein [Deltaproteobacteria bacterium]